MRLITALCIWKSQKWNGRQPGPGRIRKSAFERISNNFYALGKGIQNFALWFLGGMPFLDPDRGNYIGYLYPLQKKEEKDRKENERIRSSRASGGIKEAPAGKQRRERIHTDLSPSLLSVKPVLRQESV